MVLLLEKVKTEGIKMDTNFSEGFEKVAWGKSWDRSMDASDQVGDLTTKLTIQAEKAIGRKNLIGLHGNARSRRVNKWIRKNHSKHKDLFPKAGF